MTLYVTGRGLTTGLTLRRARLPDRLDFVQHRLIVTLDDGQLNSMPLVEQAIADFYTDLFALLEKFELKIQINRTPNEVSNPIPFDRDHEHPGLRRAGSAPLRRALVQIEKIHACSAAFSARSARCISSGAVLILAVTFFRAGAPRFAAECTPGLPDAVVQESSRTK